MGTQTTNSGRKLYYYYRCNRVNDYLRHLCKNKSTRAERAEKAVWEFVSGLLKDPERIRAGMEALIQREMEAGSREPEQEARRWAEKLEECVRLRRAYQEQQAAGLMDLEELRERLGEIEHTRRLAQTELDALADHMSRVEQLEKDREALLKQMADFLPENLDRLTPEEHNKLYRMLRLKVVSDIEGLHISGAFCISEPLPS